MSGLPAKTSSVGELRSIKAAKKRSNDASDIQVRSQPGPSRPVASHSNAISALDSGHPRQANVTLAPKSTKRAVPLATPTSSGFSGRETPFHQQSRDGVQVPFAVPTAKRPHIPQWTSSRQPQSRTFTNPQINPQLGRRYPAIPKYLPPPITGPVKSSKLILPLWDSEDQRYLRHLDIPTPTTGSLPRKIIGSQARMAIASATRRQQASTPSSRGLLTRRKEEFPLFRAGANLELYSTDDDSIEMVRPVGARKSAGGVDPTRQLATKAARKTKATFDGSDSESESTSSLSDDFDQLQPSDEALEPRPPPSPLAENEQRLPSPSLPMVNRDELLQPSKDISDGIIKALEALSLPSLHMQRTKQLPFLLRNLRRGFRRRCAQVGILTIPDKQEVTVRVIHQLIVGKRAKEEYEAEINDWRCPLCALHGQFVNRDMLVKHLEWDHEEVRVQWESRGARAWKIILSFPIRTTEDNTGARPSSAPAPFLVAEGISGVSRDELLIHRHRSPAQQSTTTSPPSLPSPAIPTPTLSTEPDSASTTPQPKFKFRSPSPPSTRSSSFPFTSRSRSTTTATAKPRKPSPRHPTPPPPDNPLGPSAQYPFLPAESEYDGPTIYYSCRPGGPRLYDLLGTLPMEPFGVMAWYIVDREEEIFEVDDIKDEHKVIHALWNRWIFLNRTAFIRNYYLGAIAFVDEYWRMIHRAAGWEALRYMLLILMITRFLTSSEVARVLKHYEGLTGMDDWYKE